MPIIIKGHPISTCTRRVLMTLEELGVPYELEVIDIMKGASHAPDYVKNFQPFGKIPVLVDGDVQIFESRAIQRYLAHKYADKVNLVGSTPAEKGLVDTWQEAEAQNYNGPVSTIVYEKVFKAWRGGAADEAVVAAQVEALEKVLDSYETVLSDGRPYIAGQNFSIADISYIPYGALLTTAAGFGDLFAKRPHFKAWWDRITSRPTWAKLNAPPS